MRFLFVVACVISVSASANAAGAAHPKGSSPILARVFAAWKAREERVKTLHLKWEYRLAFPKGYGFPEAPVVGGLKGNGLTVKSDGVQYAMPGSEFWSEGADRLRDDFSVVERRSTELWKAIERYSVTISGAKHTRLKVPIGSDESSQVVIWNESNPGRVGDAQLDARPDDLAPLLLTFRPFHRIYGWSRERCRLVSENELVGATRCLTIQMDEISKSERCWVDQSRDYTIVKWEKRQPGSPTVSVTIDSQKDAFHGWIPSRWKRKLLGSTANATGIAEAVVTRYVVNERLPTSTFAPIFPPGTDVADLSVDPLVPRNTENNKPPKRPLNLPYDLFADAAKDVDAALKIAKDRKKRVLIDFGTNWCSSCLVLANIFMDDPDVCAALEKGFVLVFISIDSESGREVNERYVPKHQRNGIPHLAVLDFNGNVLRNEMSDFAEAGHDFDLGKLKAFLSQWSPSK